MLNPKATAPRSKTPARSLVSRAPGLLIAVAALLVSFSGAAAPALDTAEVAPPPLPNIDEAADPAPQEEAAETAGAATPTASTDDDRLSFTTGDRLTEEQLAEYHAHIAALKAEGKHRGIAVYSSW